MISVGQTVGNYKVTAKLGEGGMGVVYLAEHPVIGRKVALKAIHPELSKNPEVISRFMTEAKSVNQIGNEHIVDISDFGNTDEGEFYFVMEFLQGEALADCLRREKHFDPARALKIAAQVADALAASHAMGIIHRDLKPENIYLIQRGATRDFVKVLDFGLAKLTQGDEKVTHKTRTGSVMGTPYYMSPEQCEGRADLDHRADIYSLGIILFEMMTGKVPFGGEGYGEIIVKHITQPPPSPRAINPTVSDGQEAVILHAMAKGREARFQTMGDFRTAILDPHAFLAGAPSRPASDASSVGAQVGRQTVGAEAKPLPTTFGQGAGEVDDDFEVPKSSRKGLMFGVIGGVAVAAMVAFFALRGDPPPAEPEVTPPVAAVTPPPVPVEPEEPKAPKTVSILFRSEPDGADVVVKATGEILGKTPLDKNYPFGEDRVEFVFRREGFEEKMMGHTPSINTKLMASLDKEDKPEKVKRVSSHSPRKPAKVSVAPPPLDTKPPKPKKPTVLDEDAVLEPQF